MKLKLILLITMLLVACEPSSLPEFSTTDTIIAEDDVNLIDSSFIKGEVVEVIDGDTYKIKIMEDFNNQILAGETITLRALLIDTPESVGPNAGMILGKEASTFTRDLIEGKEVDVEFGEEGHLTDKYDRYLGYVYYENRRIQDTLLEQGLAMVRYIYEPNTKYLVELRDIEKLARDKNIGIWSIENYVNIEEGFNDIENNQSVSESLSKDLEEIILEEGEKLAEDLLDEALKTLMDQF